MKIIRKKKDNSQYYYLRHSFRKNGKVITKDKYLGKEIPKDIDEIKNAFIEECHRAGLFGLFEKIRAGFQKELRRYPESVKEKVMEQLAIAFTYNTNAIEGSTITLEETRELVEHKIAPNKPLQDIKETEAHVKVFLEMISKKDTFGIPLIIKWHKELFKETKPDIAGEFRDYLVKVGDYLAPDWQDVKQLMKELAEFYEKNKRLDAVELAAKMHYRFEKIHPFGDGNGRVGRLVMNYILWHNKCPMITIEYKKRRSYYKALQKDDDYFFHYFARRYLSVHKRYLR